LGHIAVISEEINRPSPGLVDAIEQLAREVHTDAFRELENGKVKMENGHGPREMERANFGVQELRGLRPRDLSANGLSPLKRRPTNQERAAEALRAAIKPGSTAASDACAGATL